MAKLYNLARMTTATTGTGTITLGAAVSGYLTFALAGASNADVVAYAIKDGANSESGTGTYTTAGTTLTRSVTKSTNANAAISLSGSAEVFISPRAEDLLSVLETQTANQVFAGPASGSAAAPTFRALVAADGWSPLAVLTAANSATLADTTHITSAYDLYRITLTNVLPFTNNGGLNMRITEDGGSSYPATSYVSSICGTLGDTVFRFESSTSAIRLSGQNTSFDGVSNASAYGVNGVLFFQNPNSTTSRKSISGTTMWMSGNASRVNVGTVGGLYDGDNTAVNGIQFFFSSGNIITGTIKIDGMKTS